MWHTLSSHIPMCIFLTLPPSFSHSLSHIAPRLAVYSLPQLLWKDICLPGDSSIPACLAVAQLWLHIFFLPAVYLFADQSSLSNLHHSETGCTQSRYTADHVLTTWWHGHTFKYTQAILFAPTNTMPFTLRNTTHIQIWMELHTNTNMSLNKDSQAVYCDRFKRSFLYTCM